MDADTPRNRSDRGKPLLRTTDYARTLLRRAQLALALLAVPVAVAVGVLVAAQPGTPPPVPPTAAVALTTNYEPPSRVELLPGSLVALDRADEIARGLAMSAGYRPTVDGLMAGLSTLSCCWVLLGAAGVIWRRRLDDRDLREWAAGWARVEPHWSGRRV